MGTRGMTAIPSLILGSTTIKVLHLTHILVVLIH
jgi:nucleotide-binding universal stress UspA family protein